MKQILQYLLSFIAKKIIIKYKPIVVGITGSVGKTSARKAISLVLSSSMSVRSSNKNYNNELGLPLTIIGEDPKGKNVFGWLFVLLKGLFVWLYPVDFPKVLVLEMGIDKPGDMDNLLDIVKPDIGVITSIAENHYAQFESPTGIETEKGKLAEALSSEGVLIVNADNLIASRQKNKTKAKVYSYGRAVLADIRVLASKTVLEPEVHTVIVYGYADNEFSVQIPSIGEAHILATTAAAAVGLICGISVSALQDSLLDYTPEVGRMNPLPGKNGSVLLDDSYNASPVSVRAALELLSSFSPRRRIAVLGDMLELGSISDDKHKEIGHMSIGGNVDILVTVGERAKLIAQGAMEKGFPQEKVRIYRDIFSAIYFLQEEITAQDIILVKGSQGMRMEKISKELLSDEVVASDVLCRQYGKWLRN